MKKIIILGATGFIGRNLTNYFAKQKGYKVFSVYNKKKPWKNNKVKFLKADLTNKNNVNMIKRKPNKCLIL